MNIGEANAVQILLRRHYDTPGASRGFEDDDLHQRAAEFLADRAHAALKAGPRAKDIGPERLHEF